MPVISVYSYHKEVRREAKEVISHLARGQPENIQVDCCDSFSGFLDSARRNPCRILLLAQAGPLGADMAAEVRECFPKHRFVWFSDLDFGLFAYRLEADYFSLLPLTEDKLRSALRNCSHHPPPFPMPTSSRAAEKPVAKSRPPTFFGRIMEMLQVSGFF